MKLKSLKRRFVRFYLLALLILLSGLFAQYGINKTFAAESPALELVNLVNLPDGTSQLQLSFSQAVSTPKVFSLNAPERLIIDFFKVRDGFKQKQQLVKQVIDSQLVKGINVTDNRDRTRVMLYLKQLADYKIIPQGKYVVVNLSRKLEPQTQAANFAAQQLSQVDFRKGDNGSGQIVFKMSDPNANVNFTKRDQRLFIELKNINTPAAVQKRYDVTDFGTPVKSFTVSMLGKNTRIAVDVKGHYDQISYVVNHQLIVDIKPAATAGTYEVAANKASYNGKRISLNFQDIKVRAVLQIIAEFTGLNIVSSDQVKGNVTLRLKDVPWDQALDIILKSQGLAKRQFGNVLLVAPAEELALREKQELQAQQQVADLEPLQPALIQINYGKASEIATLLKDKNNSLLSARGSVSVDARTNTLWVQDTQAKLAQIRDLVQRLDIPVKQVLIEARIVVMSKKYQEDLGIKFGVNQGHLGSNLDTATKLVNGTPLGSINAADRLNMNLAVPAASSPGTVGLAMMRLGNTGAFLDLELSALESDGGAHVLSSPRLLTSNQQAATIQSGEEIPYQESTSSGATSVAFKKAVLSLTVTPQITPDNRIMLDLQVNQDKRGLQTTSANVPAIDTRQITTKVLINNGETLVLGGIYEQNDSKTVKRIPFLSALPVLGVLFKNSQTVKDRSELLIFVTPKIIEQGAVETT